MKKTKDLIDQKRKKGRFWFNFKRSWRLHLLMLLPLLYIIIFAYVPMFGLSIAFMDYVPGRSILECDFVGLQHFKDFFSNVMWTTYLKNTLRISVYSILVGFPVPIALALMLHVNENKALVRVTQNVSYIPHFISVVIMVGILNQVFNPFSGLWGSLQQLLGLSFTSDIRSDPDSFVHLYVWSGVWQNMGWDTIIYVSALSAVSQELHEAARLDGASRFKRIIHVDIPSIMPTIAILFIMRFGSVMSVGYEKTYLMQNTLNLATSEVISTYVYKMGLGKNNMSYGTAVGLMNSVINMIMVLFANKFTRKITDDEISLF